jgi:hypothetical protein
MLIKVVVTGPDDLVERVCSLGAEYPRLKLIPAPYTNEVELPLMYPQIYKSSDIIVFTGPVIYQAIRSTEKPSKPVLYTPLHGSGLLRCMYLLERQDHFDPKRISIDILEKSVINETYQEIGLPVDGVFIKENVSSLSAASDELTSFHHDLWKEGKTSVALTCLRSTYTKLSDLGVPVLRILPTLDASREVLNKAVIVGMQLDSMHTQIAVQVCHIAREQGNYSRYEDERFKLMISQILNNYAEKTWASIHRTSEDRYLIFTTRGSLENSTHYYQSDPLLENLKSKINATVTTGIGLGNTAFHAENHAERALKRALEQGGNCTYILIDNENLVGPIGKSATLKTKVKETDKDILAAAHKSGLSIETISKIKEAIKLLGRDGITSFELAQALQVKPRSARRLISNMISAGYAQETGKEQTNSMGRPRSIYRIQLP